MVYDVCSAYVLEIKYSEYLSCWCITQTNKTFTFAIIPARPPQTILRVISAAPFVADDDAFIVGALFDWAAAILSSRVKRCTAA